MLTTMAFEVSKIKIIQQTKIFQNKDYYKKSSIHYKNNPTNKLIHLSKWATSDF